MCRHFRGCGKRGFFIDGAGDGIVNDVANFDAVVLAVEPGVDPERLGCGRFLSGRRSFEPETSIM